MYLLFSLIVVFVRWKANFFDFFLLSAGAHRIHNNQGRIYIKNKLQHTHTNNNQADGDLSILCMGRVMFFAWNLSGSAYFLKQYTTIKRRTTINKKNLKQKYMHNNQAGGGGRVYFVRVSVFG
jgi:hypothetical protein